MDDQGGGASRSDDPSLREFIDERFVALEKRLDERRDTDLRAVEMLDRRLQSIELAVGVTSTQRIAWRTLWSDLRSVVVFGFVALGGIIALLVYLGH